MQDQFLLKTDQFEGPLDLLLSLIEKRKLFINDISLSKVADDYIAYVENLDTLPIDSTAQFILIASTLLLIKSKSLLPNLELTLEEEESISDLEDRLKLHKKYLEASKNISSIYNKTPLHFKTPQKNQVIVFSPDANTNTQSLLNAIKNVIASMPKSENLPKVIVQKVASLEEMVEKLSNRIADSLKLSFREFTGDSLHRHQVDSPLSRARKTEIIVSFLAMLELVKQGAIQVVQNSLNDDIEIATTKLSVPDYKGI
jgi:segregation and condensation protein A